MEVRIFLHTHFPRQTARALSKAVQYNRWLATPQGTARVFSDARKGDAAVIVAKALADSGSGGRWLSSEETQEILSCYGISMIQTTVAKTPEEAGRIAKQIGRKIALKGDCNWTLA